MTDYQRGYDDFKYYDTPRQSDNDEYMRGWDQALKDHYWITLCT